VEFFKEGLLKVIGSGLDFIFSNEAEALKMAQSNEISDAIAYLQTLAKGFAITRGAQGSLIYDGQKIIEIETEKVKAIDTVGAGDMYAGAFLYGLTHDLSSDKAGKLASVAASRIVTRYGARLDTEEMKSLVEQIR
jgi:sugar/nucleoside kinase (ribokinase family)